MQIEEGATGRAPKFVAAIHGVQEVALVGSADIGYWRERLKAENLYPASFAGSARLIVSATRLKFMGVRFCEFVFALSVSRDEQGATEDGLYLLAACNTFGPFAWMERNWFGTPYLHGEVRLAVGPPATIELRDKASVVVRAKLTAKPMTSPASFTSWQGPIFLPKKIASARAKCFYARLEGDTQIFPFAADDEWTIMPAPRYPVAQCLIDSNFRPQEWSVRPSAFHGKSATMPVTRSACQAARPTA